MRNYTLRKPAVIAVVGLAEAGPGYNISTLAVPGPSGASYNTDFRNLVLVTLGCCSGFEDFFGFGLQLR